MTYSGFPRIWVPRHGLGQGMTVAGRYALPMDAGTVEAGVSANATGVSANVSLPSQGFVTQVAATKARDVFRQQTGIDVPWVPTSEGQVGPWAKDMAKTWSSPYMRQGIDDAKKSLAEAGVPENPLGFEDPLGEDATAMWCEGYLKAHPDLLLHPSPQAAVAMMQAYVGTQCDAIGVPPEFIAASNLIKGFPQDIGQAESWGLTLGTSYLSQFGVPIVTSLDTTGFIQAAGRFAMSSMPGSPPFALCEATFDSLKNGSINFDEAKGLVTGACAWIGGAVGQAFGIPAPLGALLGQLIGGVLTGPVAEALGFGPSDSEKLNRAQAAAQKAAAAATIVCTDLAKALWLQYQHYWDSMQSNLDALFRANMEWLTSGGYCGPGTGIRVFPGSVPGANALLQVIDPNTGQPVTGAKGRVLYYPYPVQRDCAAMSGCAYTSWTVDHVMVRDRYDLSIDALNKGRIPAITSLPMGCADALSALAFWNARRYVTPYQVIFAMSGAAQRGAYKATDAYTSRPGTPNMYVVDYDYRPTQLEARNVRPWDADVHSDKEYLENIGHVSVAGAAGESVGDCLTPAWAQHMFLSLQQAPAASALVQRDLTRTLAMVTTLYGIQRHAEEFAGAQWAVASAAQQRQAVRAMAAKAATFRNSMLEAARRGRAKADMLNYGLLAAGGAALAGWAVAKRKR